MRQRVRGRAFGVVAVGFVFASAGAPTSTGGASSSTTLAVRDTVRIVRSLDADSFGASAPAGVAVAPDGALFATARGAGKTKVVSLDRFGRRSDAAGLAATVADPVNVAFDGDSQRLLVLDAHSAHLLEIPARGAGRLDVSATVAVHASALGAANPQGLALASSGRALYVLDARDRVIVSAQLNADGQIAAPTVERIAITGVGARGLRGLALDPSTGDFFVGSDGRLLELTHGGALTAAYDVAGVNGQSMEAMAFGPSGDQTDDPSMTSLYIVSAGPGNVSATRVLEASFTQLAATGPIAYTSSLVRTTNTAAYSPPSPDPSGLTYLPSTNTVLMTDGEVEETVSGVTHFGGANVWETTLGGAVVRTANISKVAPTAAPITNEPTGVTWNPGNGHFYVSDDDALRVYDVNPGGDGRIGTADDTWTWFDTSATGDGDPEGIAFDTWNNRLFVSDGVNAEIYAYSPTGTPLGHFDVAQYGVTDNESVEFNAGSGTLYVLSNVGNPIVVETTTSGSLLQTIDVSASHAKAPAGLAYAPASDGSGAKRFYVVDRGIDNNSDPNIVDGRMFELTAPEPVTSGNTAPTVNAGPDQTVLIADGAALDGTVSDDGVPNGTLTTFWNEVSGPGSVTFGNAGAVDTTATFSTAGTYVLQLTGSDGELSAGDAVTITVTRPDGWTALDVRVAASSDDAEESASGSVSLTSSDLELVYDGSNQTVGIRFQNVTVPRGAVIQSAYVQFTVDEAQSEATALTIAGEASDNAATYASASRAVSSRSRTVAGVGWAPAAWSTVGLAGAGQQTPDLSSLLTEIVNRQGWASGNALALMLTGTGHRTAVSYDGSRGAAPLLHVEYTASSGNTAPTVAITAPSNGATFGSGEPVTFTGTATDTQDGDLTGSIVWTSSSTGTLGVGGSVTTSSLAPGSQTVTARATDSGSVSTSASVTVTIQPPDDIFADGFDSGSLGAWSSSTTDGGNLSVTANAALFGSAGMQALINDNHEIYVTDERPVAESRYRARFWFDPNSVAMAKNDSHRLLVGLTASNATVVRVELRWNGSRYEVRAGIANDAAAVANTAWVPISDAPHALEIDWQGATGAGANNGSLGFWVDGMAKATASGVDNDTIRVDRTRLGAVSGVDSGTRGTEFFDSFVSRRTSYIGP